MLSSGYDKHNIPTIILKHPEYCECGMFDEVKPSMTSAERHLGTLRRPRDSCLAHRSLDGVSNFVIKLSSSLNY